MDQPAQQVTTPPWVWRLGVALGAVRLSAYFMLATPQYVAQWQLAYIPLWLADVPWSFVYFFAPVPLGEAVIGPVWWTLMPYLVWRGVLRQRASRGRAGTQRRGGRGR